MSYVTNVMLSVAVGDGQYDNGAGVVLLAGAAAVRDWCLSEAGHGFGWPERPIDAVSGGGKHMETTVYCWGVNYGDVAGFLEAVRTAPWRWPASVQAFVCGQDDDRFAVHNLQADRTWSVWE